MKLNIKAFALSGAVTWGAVLFLYTWWIIVTNGISGEAPALGRIYLGYTISPIGSLVGLAWAFVDGLIIGAFFAWVYNGLVRNASKSLS